MRIVFDDQKHRVAGLDVVAIIRRSCLRVATGRIGNTAIGAWWHGHAVPDVCRRRARVDQRQVQRERAALPGTLKRADFAAQQRRQFPADRQAQARAAILAARAGVGLLEGFEDQLLFFRRDADAGVARSKGP